VTSFAPQRPTDLEPLVPYRITGTPAELRGGLPQDLVDGYGSDLYLPLRSGRPTLIANFVSTLDGVVSYKTPEAAGGGEISGFFEPDRFVMALLRSIADYVLVGAGTIRADPRGRWVAASVHPPSAVATAAIRAELGLAPNPTTVVVTASGDIAAEHPGLSDSRIPVLVVTTARGRERLLAEQRLAPHVEVVALDGEHVDPTALLSLLGERGAQLVLCEGGPHLMGDLVGAHLLDELFMTVAPQLAGRTTGERRLALVEGRAFGTSEAPWAGLVDLRVCGSHLFTRYRFGGRK
jgi:riboflavin biosynthesis pyrimidine reductase